MNVLKRELRYKKCFSYDVEDTIKSIMKLDKITQRELSNRVNLSERTIRRYLNKEVTITKVVLGLICVGLELSIQITMELFKNAGIELRLIEEDIIIFNVFLKEKSVEKIYALRKMIQIE